MLTAHHLTNSHSHVVLWLLEELSQPYEMVLHRRDAVTRGSPDSLRAIHPVAKAPTIEDNGIAMVESAGIILYILDAYGEGRLRPPPGTPEAMRFHQWLTYTEGSGKAPLMQFARVAPNNPMRAEIEKAALVPLQLIETALDGQETIVPGMFTAADIQLTFFEELVEGVGQIDSRPNMKAHLERMRARDAYKRAEAKGGPVGLKQLFAGIGGR